MTDLVKGHANMLNHLQKNVLQMFYNIFVNFFSVKHFKTFLEVVTCNMER